MTTIKGYFFQAHINRLNKDKGPQYVEKLAQQFGKPLDFKSMQEYDTQEEERLVNICVQLYHENEPIEELEIESGKFHYQSFLESTIARTALTLSKNNVKMTFRLGSQMTKTMIKGVTYEYEDIGEKQAQLTYTHSPYSIKHYQGFFMGYFEDIGKKVTVETKILDEAERKYQLLFTWE